MTRLFSIYQAAFQQPPNAPLPEPAIVTSSVAAAPLVLDSAVMSGAPLDTLPVLQRDEPQAPVEPQAAVQPQVPIEPPEDRPVAATVGRYGAARPSSVPALEGAIFRPAILRLFRNSSDEKNPPTSFWNCSGTCLLGTPVEEIRRAAKCLSVSTSAHEAVAKIESDFDPKQRTGSYIGLFFSRTTTIQQYGSGETTECP